MKIELSEKSIKLLFYMSALKHFGTEHETCRHVGFIKTTSEDSAVFECLDCGIVFSSRFIDSTTKKKERSKCFSCKRIVSYPISNDRIYHSCDGITKTDECLEPIGKNCFRSKS